MNLSELLSKGLVEKFQSDPDQVKNEIEIAKSDLSSAKNMLGIEEWGWAHNAAYNALLQAGAPLMMETPASLRPGTSICSAQRIFEDSSLTS